MAVPDPHMEELRLVSYQPRPRACKHLYKVPRRNDFIEVLWCMDHLPTLPNRWCAAEVLHISDHPDQGIMGQAVILYLPGDRWDEQVEQVEFLDNYKLRCAAQSKGDATEGTSSLPSGSEGAENTNPELEWRFRKEVQEYSKSDSDEDEWEALPRPASENRNAKRSARPKLYSVRGCSDHVEIRSLRDGHAAVVMEVEKLKREMLKLSRYVAEMRNSRVQRGRCISADCVLPRLRQKLALKMQLGLRQATTTSRKRDLDESEQTPLLSSVDGLHCGILRARVECTLQQFESVSFHISSNSPADSVSFFPPFSFTQLPSQCSSLFRILFNTFSHLCDMIGVFSAGDKKEMARKCGSGGRGKLLRMLGTYAYDEDNDKSAARFYPAASCGAQSSLSVVETEQFPSGEGGSQNHLEAVHARLYPVFTRKTREWDKVDGRYVHGLRKDIVALQRSTERSSESQVFALTWKRAVTVAGKAWSHSLWETGDVFGYLEVSLPFVQAQARYSCQEIGGMINDDVWDDLLSCENTTKRVK